MFQDLHVKIVLQAALLAQMPIHVQHVLATITFQALLAFNSVPLGNMAIHIIINVQVRDSKTNISLRLHD